MSNGDVTLGIRITADGKEAAAEVKTTTGEIDKLGASTRTASSEAERLNVSLRNQTLQMASARDAARQSSVAVTETAGSVTKLLDKYDQTGAKLRQLQADFKALDQAASSGKLAAKDDARLDSVYAKIQAEIKAAEAAAAGFGPAASAGFAQATAGAEKSAFATAGARRELMVLGHEVVQGNFSRIPGSMMVLAERTGVSTAAFVGLGGAVVGVAAVVAAFAVAAHQGTEEMKATNAAMDMTGNYSGQTADSLLGLARNASEASHQTVGAAKEMVTALAESGHIGEAAFGSIAQAAVLYSQASGKSLDEVTPKLIKAFEDPAKGAAELNNTLHFLSPAELEHIKNLQEMGDVSAAQSALAEELNKKLAGIQPSLGTLETAWDGVKKAASSAWDAMMSAGRKNTLGEELDQAKAKLVGMQQALQEYQQGSRGRFFAPSQAEIDQQQSYVKGLEEKKAAQTESAKAASASAAENEKTAATWDMITKSSGAYHKQQLQNQIDRIRGYKAANAEEAKFQADAIADLQKQIDGPAKKAVAESTTAYNSLVKSIEGRIAVAEAESTTTEKLSAGQAAAAKFTELVGAGVLKLTETEKQNITALLEKEIAIEKANAAADRARKIGAEWAASNAKLAQSIQQSNTSLEADIVSLQRHNEEIGLSTEQLATLTLRRMDDTIAIAEQRLEQTELTDANADYVSGLMDQVRLLREKRGLMVDGQVKQAAADQVKTEVEARKKGWEETDRIAREIFTGWGTANEDVATRIGKALRSALMNAIYEATIRPLVFQIYNAGSSALGMGGSGQPGGLGGVSNVPSIGTSASNWTNTANQIYSTGSIFGTTGAYASGVSGLAATGTTSQAAMLAAQTGEFGAAGLTATAEAGGGMMAAGSGALAAVATAIPWIAAIYALYTIFSEEGGGPKTGGSFNADFTRTGIATSQTERLYTPNQQDDQLRTSVGGLEAAYRGVTAALGQSYQDVSFGLGFDSDPEGTADNRISGFARVGGHEVFRQQDRGYGRDEDALRQGLTDTAGEMLRAALLPAFRAVSEELAAELEDFAGNAEETALFASGLADMNKYLGDSAAGVRLFGEQLDMEMVRGLSEGTENITQTFQRLQSEFSLTNQIAEQMGKDSASAFGAVGLASEGARAALISAAGGLDALSAKTSGFFQRYYSESERQQASARYSLAVVNDGFAQLNISVPRSMGEFRSLAEAQDLSTESGRRVFLAMMDLEGAFANVAAAGGAAAISLGRSAAQMAAAAGSAAIARAPIVTPNPTTGGLYVNNNRIAGDNARFQEVYRQALDEVNAYSAANVSGTQVMFGANSDPKLNQELAGALAGYRIGGYTAPTGGIVTVLENLGFIPPSHATGLDYVPYDGYFAELHRGEIVIDGTTADALRRYGIPMAVPAANDDWRHRALPDRGPVIDIAPLLDELKQLRAQVAELSEGQFAVARATIDTSRQLERWDDDGLPATRVAA